MKRSLQFFVHQRYRSLNPSAKFKLIRKVLQLDAIIYCLSVCKRELEIDYWNVSLSLSLSLLQRKHWEKTIRKYDKRNENETERKLL